MPIPKAPNKIFLQWHTDECPENCNDEVTWCEDRIEETDVEYIRAGYIPSLVFINARKSGKNILASLEREKYWQMKVGRMAVIANGLYHHVKDSDLSENEQDEVHDMYQDVVEMLAFDDEIE